MDRYVYDVIKQYYKVLSYVGYKNDEEVKKILALTYIYDMTQHDTHGHLRHEDYKLIERALLCLNCGCTVPFPRLYDPKVIENQCPDSWSDEERQRRTDADETVVVKRPEVVEHVEVITPKYDDSTETLTLSL